MGKIKKDFLRGELRRLVLCAAGLVLCLLILLRCYPKLASYQPLPLLGIPAIIGLSALRPAMQSRAAIGSLTDTDRYFLEREYPASHPTYKVWQGEIHLLRSFIVCRNRGRLLFIPIHKIERAEHRFEHAGMWKIPSITFILDTGQSIAIGFSPSHPKDSEAVFTWLRNRLGCEKAIH